MFSGYCVFNPPLPRPFQVTAGKGAKVSRHPIPMFILIWHWFDLGMPQQHQPKHIKSSTKKNYRTILKELLLSNHSKRTGKK